MQWDDILSEEIKQWKDLFTEKIWLMEENGVKICPPKNMIFRALELTPPDRVKAVIIGQDPYHTPGAANGLAFSISPGRKLQPSLRNIFRELCDDTGCGMPENGDLTKWAKEGVLLLNTVLTVEAGKANSHKDLGWQNYTKGIFLKCLELPQPVVFIFWGKQAQSFAEGIDWNLFDKKMMIRSAHPSPMSASRGFFGSRPFSKTNDFLIRNGSKPVKW